MIWVAFPLHLLLLYAVGFVVTWVMAFGTLYAIERINPLELEVHGSRTDLVEDGITATFAAIAWPLVVICIAVLILLQIGSDFK